MPLPLRLLCVMMRSHESVIQDLVPKDNVLAWLRYLRHDFPTVPLKSNANARHRSHVRPSATDPQGQGAPHLLTLLKSYRRAHTSLTVGVVGPPNVGKSSLINALSRLRGDGKDTVTVGAKPGETRAIKEVGLEKGLKVLDMPGIVWGDFLSDGLTSTEGDSKTAAVGSLSMVGVEYLDDPVGAGQYPLSIFFFYMFSDLVYQWRRLSLVFLPRPFNSSIMCQPTRMLPSS